MLRLNQSEKLAFLRVCRENVERITLVQPQTEATEKQLRALQDLESLVSNSRKNEREWHVEYATRLLNESFASDKDYDAELMRFLYQFNYSHWMNYQERTEFRKTIAKKEFYILLQDERFVEHALSLPQWFTPEFEAHRVQNKLTYRQAIEQSLPSLNVIDEHTIHRVGSFIKNAFGEDGYAELAKVCTFSQLIIIASVIMEAETLYCRQDSEIDTEKLMQAMGQASPIEAGENVDVYNFNLSKKAEEPRMPIQRGKVLCQNDDWLTAVKKCVGGNTGATIEHKSLNDKGKDEKSTAEPATKTAGLAYLDGYYTYPNKKIPECARTLEDFKRDFSSSENNVGMCVLNGKSRLVVGDTNLVQSVKAQLPESVTRHISDKALEEVLCVLNQSLLSFGPKTRLSEATAAEDCRLSINWANHSAAMDEFELIAKSDDEIYVKVNCQQHELPIVHTSENFEQTNVGTLPASFEMVYQFKRGEDGLGYFEWVQFCTDNHDLHEIMHGASIERSAQERMLKKYCDNQNQVVVDELKRLNDVADSDLVKFNQDRQLVFDGYVNKLTALFDNNSAVNASLIPEAKKVLEEVKNLRKKIWPKVPEGELNSVLHYTIELLQTPMLSRVPGFQTELNQDYLNKMQAYSNITNNFKRKGRNKILAGAMTALIGVALIVGAALLVASTWGAGAAIGIPMLVAAKYAVHFTVGMAIAKVLGTGLGLFGAKAIDRGVSESKLAGAMSKLNNKAVDIPEITQLAQAEPINLPSRARYD